MNEIKINCSYTELKDALHLVPHPKNPNKHTKDQVDLLARLITFYGFRHPIIISKQSGFIVAGHGRLEAAKKLRLAEVPVDYQDFENDAQEYGFLVADNAIAGWSELDLSRINTDVSDLGPDFDVDMLGIKDFEIEPADKLEPGCDEDSVPEKVEPKTKLGDLYTLGNHRLLCGDSTNIQHVDRLFGSEKTEITFTSPPYNAAANGHLTDEVKGFDSKYRQHDDAMSDDDYLSLLTGFTNIALLNSKYVFVNLQLLSHNRGPLFKYQEQFQTSIKDILIWNKRTCPPNIVKGAFNTKWEYVFCFSEDIKTRGFPVEWRGQYPNVIETESNTGNEFAGQHKAGFPVSLPCWVLEKLDFANRVYDPFGGTGTTMIACEKTNRSCFMMELDPHYCDVIVSRWEKYTGKKAVLNGQTSEEN